MSLELKASCQGRFPVLSVELALDGSVVAIKLWQMDRKGNLR